VPRLGAGLRFDSRDRALQPRNGFFAEGRLTQNGGPLGGPGDYFEGLLDLRGYISAARHGFATGVLFQPRGVRAMGRYDFFHVGGANTLRGFPENAMQGRNECLFGGEYRFDLLPERLQRLGPWSINYGLQFTMGADGASLWNKISGLGALDSAFVGGGYVGIGLLNGLLIAHPQQLFL